MPNDATARDLAPVALEPTSLLDPFRRLSPRVAAELPVVLHMGSAAGSLQARTRDVGTAGLCVATPSPFPCASLSRVILELPSGQLSLAAEGRWQQESADEDGILTGVRFIDPPAHAWTSLWKLVQERSREIFSFLSEAGNLPLDFDERMELSLFTRLRRMPSGRYIYRQGDPGLRSVFLVFGGQVVLETEIRGRRLTLARLHRGDAFGGLGLLAADPVPESAVAATELQLLEIEPYTARYLEVVRPALARRIRQVVFQAYLGRFQDLLERQLPTPPASLLGRPRA